MSELISAALMLLVGVPFAVACYFGYAFLRQAWRARHPKSPPQ